MEINKLFIVILATYRIARLLPKDDGPFFVFKRIRSFTMTKMVAENEEWGFWNMINEAATCPHCMGLYAATLCGLLVLLRQREENKSLNNFYANFFLLIMAVAGGQSLLQSIGEKK